jgi:hypothetical protein
MLYKITNIEDLDEIKTHLCSHLLQEEDKEEDKEEEKEDKEGEDCVLVVVELGGDCVLVVVLLVMIQG